MSVHNILFVICNLDFAENIAFCSHRHMWCETTCPWYVGPVKTILWFGTVDAFNGTYLWFCLIALGTAQCLCSVSPHLQVPLTIWPPFYLLFYHFPKFNSSYPHYLAQMHAPVGAPCSKPAHLTHPALSDGGCWCPRFHTFFTIVLKWRCDVCFPHSQTWLLTHLIGQQQRCPIYRQQWDCCCGSQFQKPGPTLEGSVPFIVDEMIQYFW